MRADRRKKKKKNDGIDPILQRTTFRTSRQMDFFSERELVTQTGHPRKEWPCVIAKELMDNAMDACEETNIAPIIDVIADASGVTVADNGPGLPESTLNAAMDFNIRASNREAYAAPDRGAQGNAVKTLLSMPWVLDPEHGRMLVEMNGQRHIISCGADPISQRAAIRHDVVEAKSKRTHSRRGPNNQGFSGTSIRLEWGPQSDETLDIRCPDTVSGWPFDKNEAISYWRDDVRRIVEGFALFNPHATIRLHWFGAEMVWNATNAAWPKWRPCQPTSAHWYELRHLERLIGAYVTLDQETDSDRLVSDFIAEFHGLTGSQKRSMVLREAGLHRVRLSELVIGDKFDSERIRALLTAM